MIYTGLNRTGEILAVKAHGGYDVAEVYGGINYQNPIFYSRKTLVGTSPLTFKGLGQSLKDYHIFGETVQDGTPSPDYPVDVQGVGERTENLLDLNREYSSSFTLDDTKWMIGAVSTKNVGNQYADVAVYFDKIVVTSKSAGYGASFLVKAKPNTDYYISYRCSITDESKDRIAIGSRDASGNSSKYVGVFKTSAIYTTSETAKYINICFRCHPSFGEAEFSEIIVCESDSQKQYEPYGYKIPITIENVTTPIYIGFDPLYRSGDNADEVDFGNQQIIRRIDPTTMQPYATPTTSTITVPQLTAAVGDNTLTVDTTVKPSAVSITGHIKPTGYGQLLDMNNVDIQDSTGEPIYIQG